MIFYHHRNVEENLRDMMEFVDLEGAEFLGSGLENLEFEVA